MTLIFPKSVPEIEETEPLGRTVGREQATSPVALVFSFTMISWGIELDGEIVTVADLLAGIIMAVVVIVARQISKTRTFVFIMFSPLYC
jgi:hypothetical protein